MASHLKMTVARCQSEMTSTEFLDWLVWLDQQEKKAWEEHSKIEHYLAEIKRFVQNMPLTKGAKGRLDKDDGFITFKFEKVEERPLEDKIDAAIQRDAAILGITIPPKEG